MENDGVERIVVLKGYYHLNGCLDEDTMLKNVWYQYEILLITQKWLVAVQM